MVLVKEKWHKEALIGAKRNKVSGKFRVIVIDPPYTSTGCKLGYPLLKDEDWIDAIDFDMLIDDGFIFMWVTNAKAHKVSTLMAKRGWRECTMVVWEKFSQYGLPLRRGGFDMRHVHEICKVYKRFNPINRSDAF
jgi:N6-adenosine-specific RNA methylase IME4